LPPILPGLASSQIRSNHFLGSNTVDGDGNFSKLDWPLARRKTLNLSDMSSLIGYEPTTVNHNSVSDR
jgi:hypothetical protein